MVIYMFLLNFYESQHMHKSPNTHKHYQSLINSTWTEKKKIYLLHYPGDGEHFFAACFFSVLISLVFSISRIK